MDESTRQAWVKTGETVQIQLEGVVSPLFLTPKVFKTGSVGWYFSGKAVLSDTPCQVSVCITVIGSKRPVSPEQVNGKSPYGDGFHAASLLDAKPEEGQKPPKASKRPGKGK